MSELADADARSLALETVSAVAAALRHGIDAGALFGTLLPVLLAAAVEAVGAEVVLREMEQQLADIRRSAAN
jgi:hypothetical protein